MKKYGLIGWPVKHSVSPPMQNAGFEAAGINASYNLVEVSPDNMQNVIPKMKKEYAGWNCTVPHKSHIIEFLDEIDKTAEVLNSVNTVVNNNGRLKGYSTDGYGMEVSLKENFGTDIKSGSFLFIGAGGAARATALHFAMQGAAEIGILNRTVAKAEKLVDEIVAINSNVSAMADSLTPDKLKPTKYKVVIQCTSIGLKDSSVSPVTEGFLQKGQFVVDMIYKNTAFLRDAQRCGCETADGKGMLLHQGVRAWEIWTGRQAPVESMRNALDRVLSKN